MIIGFIAIVLISICGAYYAAKKEREASKAIKSGNICMYCGYYSNHDSLCKLKRYYVSPIYYCKHLKRKLTKEGVLISPENMLKLLNEDKEWLLKQEESLERDHIECILNKFINITKTDNKQ